MKINCLRCQGDMMELQQDSEQVKTYACTKCGFIESRLEPEIIRSLLEKTVKGEPNEEKPAS